MTTTQKTKGLFGCAVILPTNRFVLAQNWSLSWSKLALWKPGSTGIITLLKESLQFVIYTWLHSFLNDNCRVLNMDVAVLTHVVKL